MLFLRYYLWIVPHLLLGFVAFISFRNRLYRRLPAFFAFVLFECFQFVMLFTMTRLITPISIEAYLWFLTCGSLVSALLQLGVFYELVQSLISSHPSLQKTLRPLFTCALAFLLLFSAISSGAMRDVSRVHIMNIFETLDFSANLVLAGMLVVVLLFSRALHISWRSNATGVALGFGISACISLGTAALRSGLGTSAFIAVDITQMTAFHVSVVIWLVYLLLPDRVPAVAGRGLNESDIKFWDQELQRMARQ